LLEINIARTNMLVTVIQFGLCAVHAGLRGSCFITFLNYEISYATEGV